MKHRSVAESCFTSNAYINAGDEFVAGFFYNMGVQKWGLIKCVNFYLEFSVL